MAIYTDMWSSILTTQVVPAKGQWFEYNRWRPHKNWKAESKRETYDPNLMRLEARAKKKAEAKAKEMKT